MKGIILRSAEESKGFEELVLIILSGSGTEMVFEVTVHISDTAFVGVLYFFLS